MRRVIAGGRIVDPAQGLDVVADLLVEDGLIREVTPLARGPRRDRAGAAKGADVIEAKNKLVLPGLIDLHAHLREPGDEHKETVATGLRAAVAGGFTAVCTMPNTRPVNDSAAVTRFLLERAGEAKLARLFPIGAITSGLRGEELAEIGELAEAGCVAISDDGHPVANAAVMRRAMEYAKGLGLPVIDHCEEVVVSEGGVMHEGIVSTSLGLPGIPAAAEEMMVARDLALAELTGCQVHLAHLSTSGSVRLVRDAKRRGLSVTAETCPHYFTLTHEAVRGYDTHAKMNPPLRTRADVEAIREGLRDGTIDLIATDHAPHAVEEKEQPFDQAPFGIIGLETAFALTYRLVEEGVLALDQAVAALTINPARALNLPGGTLSVGMPADLVLIDPNASWTVEPSRFYSKGKNTPFRGWKLRGRVEMTLVGGEVVYP